MGVLDSESLRWHYSNRAGSAHQAGFIGLESNHFEWDPSHGTGSIVAAHELGLSRHLSAGQHPRGTLPTTKRQRRVADLDFF